MADIVAITIIIIALCCLYVIDYFTKYNKRSNMAKYIVVHGISNKKVVKSDLALFTNGTIYLYKYFKRRGYLQTKVTLTEHMSNNPTLTFMLINVDKKLSDVVLKNNTLLSKDNSTNIYTYKIDDYVIGTLTETCFVDMYKIDIDGVISYMTLNEAKKFMELHYANCKTYKKQQVPN